MTSVKEYLEQMAKMIRGMNHKNNEWPYACMEEFVLKNGKLSVDVVKKVKHGRMKECFKNAFHLASLREGELTYVEGYALSIIPVMHAWCVDKENRVYDPTWRDGVEYYGVAFDLNFIRKTILKRRYYGVIDDWENGWPLLKGERYDDSEGRYCEDQMSRSSQRVLA